MKRKLKKAATLLCAGSMLLSSLPVQAISGTGAVEVENLENPNFDITTLPTLDDGTYNFTLDPESKLNEYDPDTYTTAKTFYFSAETAAATLTAKTGKVLYKKDKVAEADLTGLKGAITAAGSAVTAVTAGFYLWVPDASALDTAGTTGKWLTIDKDNIDTYFKITYTDATTVGTIDFKNVKITGSACNGKVYKESYVSIASDPVSDFITPNASGAVQSVTGLYGGDDGSSDTPTEITTANLETYATYTAATTGFTDVSEKFTIINKATKAKTVTAKITVSNPTGLTFVDSATFASTDDKASVYLAATDGTNTVAVAEDATTNDVEAEFSVDLDAYDGFANSYQGAVNAAHGGHDYIKYADPNPSFSTKTITLKGASNDNAGAKDAWVAYQKTLASASRPGVNVVYTIADKVTKYAITNASGNEADATFKVSGTAVTKAVKNDEVTIIPGTVDGKVVDKVTIKVGSAAAEEVEADTDGDYKFTVDEDDVEVAVTYKVANVAPSVNGGTLTFTYSKASNSDLEMAFDLGSGTSGAIAVTDFGLKYNNTVYLKNGTGGTSTALAGYLTIDTTNKKVIMAAENCANFPNGTYPFYVLFDDDASNPITIQVTFED